MFKLIGPLLLFLVVRVDATYAQSSGNVENAFRDATMHKRFFLKSMSADPVTEFRWSGTQIIATPPQLHTVAVFIPEKLTIQSDVIIISGSRKTLADAGEGKWALGGETKKLCIGTTAVSDDELLDPASSASGPCPAPEDMELEEL